MLDLDLARRLKDAGLAWRPRRGDTFAIPDRDLDDEVFAVSDLVVEVREVPHGSPVLAFNGTTEWALDSIETDEAVWLPREDQLRAVLGDAFAGLERVPGAIVSWVVTVDGAEPVRYTDVDAETAYARAVLAGLTRGPRG